MTDIAHSNRSQDGHQNVPVQIRSQEAHQHEAGMMTMPSQDYHMQIDSEQNQPMVPRRHASPAPVLDKSLLPNQTSGSPSKPEMMVKLMEMKTRLEHMEAMKYADVQKMSRMEEEEEI